jgi:hypothetical protein
MTGWVIAMGTIVVALLGAGCATQGDVAVSAMVRTDVGRVAVSPVDVIRIKVDLSEIVTP